MPSEEMRAVSVCVVVPCYNEENVIPVTIPTLLAILDETAGGGLLNSYSILLVDDGSSDSTWDIIASWAASDVHIEGLKLSRNFGHQYALLAGLMEARGEYDAVISMDCDGQDDVDVVPHMVEQHLHGCDVVYGVRSSREQDTLFKRLSAEAFYRLLNSMGVEAVFNHADCRLLSSRALDALAEFGESNLFLRGMVPLLGFSSGTVEYERRGRVAGESHYPLGKMISLAFDGITSFSIKPIRLVSACGAVLSVASLVGIIWAVLMVATGNSVSGWASLFVVILFAGGLQLMALGVIGEYIGRIYLESKHRPRYIVESSTIRGHHEA